MEVPAAARARLKKRARIGFWVTASAMVLALGVWTAQAASPPGYTISGSGSSYTATPTGGGSGYSGSLKSVVERAARDLSDGGGGTITFGSGLFDLGSSYFEFDDISDVTFAGQGIDSTVIQNSSSSSSDTEPFDTSTTRNLVVRDMTVNAGGSARSTSDAIDFDGGNGNLVERVKVAKSRGRGIVFDGKDIVSGKQRTSEGNVVRDCVISGLPSHGIQFLAASNNRVEGCTVTNVDGHGIQATKSSSSADQAHKQSSGNLITANFIDNSGGNGVDVNSGDGNEILGNTILNSGNVTTGRDGIRISSNDGIACDDNRIANNRASDTQSSKTQGYGLNITSPLCHATVVGPGNDFTGNSKGQINDSGTGTIFVTAPAPDSTPPTAPTGLNGIAASSTRIDLTWNASSDNIAVAGYRVFRDGAQIATSTSTSHSDTSVQPGSAHSYYVRAYDASGNVSGQSGAVNVSTPPDTTAPTAPTGLNGTAASETRINLSWNASTDDIGVVRYRVFRDGAEIATSTATNYADTTVQPGSTHSYHVTAEDSAGNVSGPSNAVIVSTPDTTAPTAPTGLTGFAASTTQVELSWTASSDNVGVAGYRIFRDGAEVGTSTATSYADAGLEPGSTHGYEVRARDGAGNASGPSASVSVTTPRLPGVQAFTSTFTPSDDATVAEGQPTTNFGSGPLEADASPKKDFLLSFVVSGIGNGTVRAAKLRLRAIDPSSSGGRVRGADGGWNENVVTWRTAPAAGSTGPAALGGVSSGRWYEIDVTQLVVGDGAAGFRVSSTSNDGVDYASKETSTKPELVVDWETAPPPPPVTPAPVAGLPLTAVPGGTGPASPGAPATAGTQPAVGIRGIGRTVGKLRRKGLLVSVKCPAEGCVAKARGTLSRRGSRRKLKLRSTSGRIAAGAKANLRLRLSRRALKALRRARARHKKLVLALVVEIRFESGRTTTLRRKLQL
jgi:chitodextrinase